MKQRKASAIPCDQIEQPDVQLRETINPDQLRELADSISAVGLLNPIHVTQTNGRFRIIAGHRRYLAHQLLHKLTIDAFIVTGDELDQIRRSAHENLFRTDLTPIEEAGLIDYLHTNEHKDYDQIAAALSRSTAWVRGRHELLQLHPLLTRALHDGAISTSAARGLSSITDPGYLQTALDAARGAGMTERTALEWARQFELYRQAQDTGQIPIMPTPALVASEASKTSCDFCQQLHYINTTKIMRICFDCLQALNAPTR